MLWISPFLIFRKRPGSFNPEKGDQKKIHQSPAKLISLSEDMSERVKLLRMTKKDTQDMSSYCQELQLQADKCGIQGGRDIIIRDRLIQAITEEAVLAEVIRMRSPTAAEVLAKYNEIVPVSCQGMLHRVSLLRISVFIY